MTGSREVRRGTPGKKSWTLSPFSLSATITLPTTVHSRNSEASGPPTAYRALTSLKPYAGEELTFYKGCDPAVEQYSGFEAMNSAGQSLGEILSLLDTTDVYVCGIATEYCVRSTCEDILRAGMKVHLLSPALAWVDDEGHKKALKEMAEEGISVEK